ncbi:hypothetical protein BOTBODRAFT_262923 [Botryobasidium botryosum FD-172 SS1]|uniref:Uncharacterized protein n=1 Tax=Botryobasidium botryosum (strain FD-172 SS1) TaxID=930990 RepID=A0A067M3U5_BOTB1|nr:hypothetical protein BOTBODRAFT_262923 [Botryobasidium botryosum FD-172 SS1]
MMDDCLTPGGRLSGSHPLIALGLPASLFRTKISQVKEARAGGKLSKRRAKTPTFSWDRQRVKKLDAQCAIVLTPAAGACCISTLSLPKLDCRFSITMASLTTQSLSGD